MRFGSVTEGRLNSGTGRWLRASSEGSSRGSRNRPTPKKPTSNRKTSKGIKTISLDLLMFPPPSSGCSRFGASTLAIARVGCCQQTTGRHQQGAEPDPAHIGLVLHAYGPGTVFQRFTQRHIEITGKAGIDRGLGHHHPACRIQTLFRTHPSIGLALV